jgi:hypothetical protein
MFELFRQCGILELFRQCGILELFPQCGILELFRQCSILELFQQCGILELLWLNELRRGFAPDFVNYKKGALDSQPQVIKFTSCLPIVGGSLRVLPNFTTLYNKKKSLYLC